MEPLTAGAIAKRRCEAQIATLAFTKAFEKTIEKLTEATLFKLKELRDKIWNRIRGNQEVATAFASAEKGSEADLNKVAEYLQSVMKSDPAFAKDIQKLADEIQQEINIGQIQGHNLQNVYGGKAHQNNANNNFGTIYQGENTINNH